MGLSAAAYARQLKALLPPGSVFKLEPESVLSKLLLGIADELARIDARAEDLQDEWDPRTAVETLPEWEATVGIPDEETSVAGTVTERQFNVTRKFVARGGASPAYFVELAALLGYSVTIDEPGNDIPSSAFPVAAGTVSYNGQPGLPDGYAANDILVALVSGNPAAPAGWTRDATSTYLSVYTRRATSSESVPNFGAGLKCRMEAWRGLTTSGSAVEAVGVVATATGALTGGYVVVVTAASITTLSRRALVLLARGDFADDGGGDPTASITYGDPAEGQPAHNRAFANGSGSSIEARGIGLWYDLLETPGPTGPASGGASLRADVGTYHSAAVMLALKPATSSIAAHTWRVNVSPPYAAATTRFRAGSRAGDRLFVRGNEAFEAVFNRWKPAHTVVVFNYL